MWMYVCMYRCPLCGGCNYVCRNTVRGLQATGLPAPSRLAEQTGSRVRAACARGHRTRRAARGARARKVLSGPPTFAARCLLVRACVCACVRACMRASAGDLRRDGCGKSRQLCAQPYRAGPQVGGRAGRCASGRGCGERQIGNPRPDAAQAGGVVPWACSTGGYLKESAGTIIWLVREYLSFSISAASSSPIGAHCVELCSSRRCARA